jgi:hypothetical protein
MMPDLHLPPFQPKLRQGKKGAEIFDVTRKKYIRLTQEEWVRQHVIHLLTDHLGYPVGVIVAEAELRYHALKKRFDLLAYDLTGKPRLIVECKAPTLPLTQSVFDQIAVYNTAIKVDYLLITNGLVHYICQVDHQDGSFRFLEHIPAFHQLG